MGEHFQENRNTPSSVCPQDAELEAFLLGSYFDIPGDTAIARHVANCSVCQDKLEEMRTYYDILSTELSHPVPPEVLSLQEKIQKQY